ncbi:PDZ domain-containing protein [Paracrocinitomix mangrovi]|uniref:M61 family metallopeptidase n=1 Tax=Paracrocinitomix mangrovi TaxID=2862509 RepID=UPI001C8DC3A5|nr:PDZ domain-containing protein [Paracrocinitomix mangrovi]UKN02760.1 PDZ domain-containing protein [Paracrocinitomix mangrovi]
MTKRFFLLLVCFYFSLNSLAIKIDYQLGMKTPNSHYFQVEMYVSDFKAKELEVKMPVWAPGSYLVREFAKSVNLVTAKDENGKDLEVTKTNKNTWIIPTKKVKKVTISYEVYAFELSVRTSFLDDSHGYVNGTSMFMYVAGEKDASGTLAIKPHASFSKISTALKSEGNNTFSYENYDQLVDCPIEIGNQEIFTFDAGGVKHTVAMYGEGNYHIPTLQRDMAKIVEAETKVFGQNPNKEYLFIVHNLTVPSGGLEHKSSTTLEVNRWTYEGSAYLGFLSLVAHEYFHLWNVKRIRPKALGPFDYDNENYTDLLWVMEGFTSYYDELILRRAGFYSEEDYIGKLIGTINYVESQPGNKVQPVAHASFDAWIKAYRHNENSVNTTISYYSKGQILAAMLDLYIINKFNAEKSLDNFMQKLWSDFYGKDGSGFTEDEFKKTLEDFLGENMDWFFDPYVYGTETVDYMKFFNGVGLKLVQSRAKVNASLGVSTSNQGGKLIVNTVYAGSAAEQQGISVNDEIIAVDGYRVDQEELSGIIGRKEVGDPIEVILSRDNIIKNYTIKLGGSNATRYQYDAAVEESYTKKFNYWLRVDLK